MVLALEYEAVCREAEHRLASGLSENEVELFVRAVIAMAVNGRADALVTFNVRDFGAVPSAFGIEVLLPREAIGRIKA